MQDCNGFSVVSTNQTKNHSPLGLFCFSAWIFTGLMQYFLCCELLWFCFVFMELGSKSLLLFCGHEGFINSSLFHFLGLIPVPVRPPHANNISSTLPTVKMVIDVSKSRAVLTTHNIAKALRSKEAVGVVDIKSWPTVVEVDDAPKKKLTNPYRAPTPEMIAYLDFSVSTTGMLSGVKVRVDGRLTCSDLTSGLEVLRREGRKGGPSFHVGRVI